MKRIDVPPDQRQWAIAVQDPNFNRVACWIWDNNIPYELHAARIRFRPHSDTIRTQFYLQYMQYCYTVEEPYPSVF